MTLRQGGIRELPRALLLSLIAATIGVVSGYVAQTTGSTLLMVLLDALAFVAAYELLSRARLEVVAAPAGGGGAPSRRRA